MRQEYRAAYWITAELMPDVAYGGTLAQGNWTPVLDKLGGLPGVGASNAYRDNFWYDKADVSVTLCPEVVVYMPEEPCRGRGRPGASEKEAVLDRIRALPGVEKIYFEDRAHAAKVREHVQWQEPLGAGDLAKVPESFYIKLADPRTYSQAEKALTGMAGVALVTQVTRP